MRNFRLVSMLLVTLALANLAFPQAASAPLQTHQQEAGGVPGDLHAAPAATSHLPANTPVITMSGVCDASKAPGSASKSECKTVITRAQFEKLVNTLQPNMTPQVRKQLANEYPQILYMSQEARKRGLDKTPHYSELLKFTQMELLKIELDHANEQAAGKISDADIKDYYDKNGDRFDEASLQRVLIPRISQTDIPKSGSTPAQVDSARKESEAAMAKLADSLHTRAAAGEDFDKLQEEAYEAAGVKSAPPPTTNPKVRRSNIPTSQASIFELKAGELSPLLNEPTGYYFYRLVSKTTTSLADAKEEIRGILSAQRLQTIRDNAQGAVSYELNQEYFGTDAPPTQGMKGGSRSMPMNNMRSAPRASQPKE